MAVEDLLISMTMIPALFLFAFSFLFDTKDARAWKVYIVPGVAKGWPIFRDIAALAATSLTVLALEGSGSYGRLSLRGLVSWVTVSFATICFPTVLDILTEKALSSTEQRPATRDIKPKAERVILFGLRYGFVGCSCLFRSSFFDAIVLLRFVKSFLVHQLPAAFTLDETECIFCEFTSKRKLWSSIVAVRVAMIAAIVNVAGNKELCIDTAPLGMGGILCFVSVQTHAINVFYDTLAMVTVNLFLFMILVSSKKVGDYLWKMKEKHGIGSVTFLFWVATVAFILTS